MTGYCPECQQVTEHKKFDTHSTKGVPVTLYRCQGRLDGVQCYGAHFAQPCATREEYEREIAEDGDPKWEYCKLCRTPKKKDSKCTVCNYGGKINADS
jgi:hypothetical protein